MGKIAYYVKNDKRKLYLNIVDRYKCTNNCVYCDKHLLELSVGTDLFLDKEPSANEILNAVYNELEHNKPEEVVFCGIGEPTIYLDTLLDVIKALKRYHIPIRLNTNGQGYLVNPDRMIVKELKDAGLELVSISLNATTKREYDKLHNPNDSNAFYSVLRFIKDCCKIGLRIYVSFVEFDGFDREKALKFCRKLGLKDNQVRFRRYIK